MPRVRRSEKDRFLEARKHLGGFGPCLKCGKVGPLIPAIRSKLPVYCSVKCDLDNRNYRYDKKRRVK